MATTNPTVYRMTIALIVFVLLTFILTITTYLFFKQKTDQQALAKAAEQSASEKGGQLLAAQQENQTLRELIGAAEGAKIDDIQADLNGLFTTDFAGFNEEPKSYGRLVAWLRGEFKRLNADIRSSSEAVKKEQEKANNAQAEATKRTNDANTQKQEAIATRDQQKADFDKKRADHEEQQKQLLAARKEAEEKASRLQRLIGTITDGGHYLSAGRQKDYRAKEAEEQLELIYAEIKSLTADLKSRNELLAKLRVADPELQAEVLAATPKFDRIDGFDGRILSVDERERTVLVSCNTTRGVRPGMILHVFAPDDARPQIGERKAVVEVTSIEGPALLRARIRRDSTHTPILTGDGVATSLWDAATSPEVVIVGYADLDGSGDNDLKHLEDLVKKAGGRIAQEVTPTTTLVVDCGTPPADKTGEAIAQESKRMSRSLATAKQYGVRVMGLDALLDAVGLSRADIRTDRLPAMTR